MNILMDKLDEVGIKERGRGRSNHKVWSREVAVKAISEGSFASGWLVSLEVTIKGMYCVKGN